MGVLEALFLDCPSVSACFCACVWVLMLLAWCLTNQRTEFHQNLVDDVVEGTDELLRFWRSKVQGQGHCEAEVGLIGKFSN